MVSKAYAKTAGKDVKASCSDRREAAEGHSVNSGAIGRARKYSGCLPLSLDGPTKSTMQPVRTEMSCIPPPPPINSSHKRQLGCLAVGMGSFSQVSLCPPFSFLGRRLPVLGPRGFVASAHWFPRKILDEDSQVCFHKGMATGRVTKTNCARPAV